MGNPQTLEANGYRIQRDVDGKFCVNDNDEVKAGPFDTEQEAAEAAHKLPPCLPKQPS